MDWFEQLKEANAMHALFDEQRDWSYATFGPPSFKGPLGPLDHLAKEVKEAAAAAALLRSRIANATGTATDRVNIARAELDLHEELADCLILMFDAAHRAGLTFADLADAAAHKLATNKARTWPAWQGTDPDKAIEHLRAGDEQ